MMRLTRDLDLPEVPWDGTANIMPLRTVPALRATGLRLENCLNSLSIWCEALRGVRAFYLVEGDEFCIAALGRHPVFGTWYLYSLAKRRNGTPSPDMTARIVDAFAAAGFPHFDGDPFGLSEWDSLTFAQTSQGLSSFA